MVMILTLVMQFYSCVFLSNTPKIAKILTYTRTVYLQFTRNRNVCGSLI